MVLQFVKVKRVESLFGDVTDRRDTYLPPRGRYRVNFAVVKTYHAYELGEL